MVCARKKLLLVSYSSVHTCVPVPANVRIEPTKKETCLSINIYLQVAVVICTAISPLLLSASPSTYLSFDPSHSPFQTAWSPAFLLSRYAGLLLN